MMKAGGNPKPRKQNQKFKPLNYKVGEYIILPKASKLLKKSFSHTINNRKSERIFSKLTLKQISTLLWHSAKVKSVLAVNENQILTHRAAPSAGGIHPVDIFVSLPSDFEKRDLYYYDPFIHKLAKINLNQSDLSNFFNDINKNLSIENATIIWFAADVKRTGVKYTNPESLVWRDTGALIMLIQLVGNALGLRSCPIGTLGKPFFSRALGGKLLNGGGLLLG